MTQTGQAAQRPCLRYTERSTMLKEGHAACVLYHVLNVFEKHSTYNLEEGRQKDNMRRHLKTDLS